MRCCQDAATQHAISALAGSRFIGVIEHPDESLFDIFDVGFLEDSGSNSGSCAGSCDLPRECHMVQFAPISVKGAGTSAAGAMANLKTHAPTYPAMGVAAEETLIDIPIAPAGEPQLTRRTPSNG